jgi:hypothetical protein
VTGEVGREAGLEDRGRRQRGVEVSAVQHLEEGVWVEGPGGPWNSCFFKDPDGNDRAVQEKPTAA